MTLEKVKHVKLENILKSLDSFTLHYTYPEKFTVWGQLLANVFDP